MEERMLTGNSTKISGTNNGDPKSRMAEYVASYYGNNSNNDVRSILNETKVGAQRRQNLQKILNTVFSTH
ncbi:hypothetical protein ACFLYQ_03805 [Chloroflexota bacterium]